jgi:hypothetical protein
LKWFECKILDVATNLLQWCDSLSTKGQGTLDHGGGRFMGQNFMVGQILKEFFEKGETKTMDGRKHLKPSCPNWKPWHLMDSKHDKCAPIVEQRQSRWSWCDV